MKSAISHQMNRSARSAPSAKRRLHGSDVPLLDLSELRIILIDDNEFATILMKRLLRIMRIAQVTICLDSLEADAAIRQSKADLVIVDIDMPGRSGLDIIHDIRHGQVGIARDIYVLVASAHVDREHVEQARDQGANWVLAKPLSFRTLYDGIVRAILDDRPFIESASYVGPCRRIKAVPLGGSSNDRRKPTEPTAHHAQKC